MRFDDLSRKRANVFAALGGVSTFDDQPLAVGRHFERCFFRKSEDIQNRFLDDDSQAITDDSEVLLHDYEVITKFIRESRKIFQDQTTAAATVLATAS